MADKKLVVVDEAMLRQVFDAFRGLREWVKAVPEDAPLPVMPGMEGDWLDEVEDSLAQALEVAEKTTNT